jgi:hypothetical protein
LRAKRLVSLAAGAAAAVLAACSNSTAPEKWTLWYIPNEPKVVMPLAQECHTFVFANVPDAKTFRVVVVRRVNGPGESREFFHSGDGFSGPLELGPVTLHDESTGYDITGETVYRVNAYVAAKSRADFDCPPPVKRPPVRPVPSPHASPPTG